MAFGGPPTTIAEFQRRKPAASRIGETAYSAMSDRLLQEYLASLGGAPEPEPAYDYAPQYATYEEPAPPPRPELATSPEWLAYLNALGLEESQFRADIDRKRGMGEIARNQQVLDIVEQGKLAREGVTGRMESRGMSRSGEKEKRLAQQRAGEGRQQSGAYTNYQSMVTGLESDLAQRLIDINARKAQQELSMRAAGYR